MPVKPNPNRRASAGAPDIGGLEMRGDALRSNVIAMPTRGERALAQTKANRDRKPNQYETRSILDLAYERDRTLWEIAHLLNFTPKRVWLTIHGNTRRADSTGKAA